HATCKYSSFSATYPPTATIYTLSLHDALPIYALVASMEKNVRKDMHPPYIGPFPGTTLTFWESMQKERPSPQQWAHRAYAELLRSEEHTSELQSRGHLVCRLLLEKKKSNQASS